MNVVAALLLIFAVIEIGNGCHDFEVMMCSLEVELADSWVLDDGSPNLEAICGMQAEFDPLADKCEVEASACKDYESLAKIAAARVRYQKAVNNYCKADTNEPVQEEIEIVEEPIVPEHVNHGSCSTVASQFALCNSRIEKDDDDITCQDLEEYNTCVAMVTSVCDDDELVARIRSRAGEIFHQAYLIVGEDC